MKAIAGEAAADAIMTIIFVILISICKMPLRASIIACGCAGLLAMRQNLMSCHLMSPAYTICDTRRDPMSMPASGHGHQLASVKSQMLCRKPLEASSGPRGSSLADLTGLANFLIDGSWHHSTAIQEPRKPYDVS